MNNLRPTIIGLLALAALLALFAQGQPAYAATFTVTKTADTNDGVCDADCSLREAIGAANALAGADTITVPAGTYTLSIAGTNENANATGDLDISDDLTINGTTQAIVDGGAIDRVFHILSGTTVTIVANSTAGGDCSGTITSAGYNLDSDGTCGLSGTGDISSGNANLGSLALNAPGTTATHALLSGSDAIDAGNPATPGSGGDACLATDQRGVARPQGSTCDIGAFELEAGVGGIAEVLVGGGEAPASTGAGAGSSSLLYAALAGVVAAGALAIAAAGWYARRRWLR